MSLPVAPPHNLWRRFTATYARILTAALALSVAILVIPVTLQMIARYTDLIPAYIWTEEMARFLFIWMIMIGAMVGVRESAHFEVDVWPTLSRLGILAMSLIFVVGGIEFTRFAWYRTSELADLPLWLIHIAWPAAGITWIVFLGEQFVDETRILLGRTNP